MFIVTELQTSEETTSVLNTVFTERNLAEQQYHTILASAAVSTVPTHAASIFNELGQTIKNEFYYHPTVTEDSGNTEE